MKITRTASKTIIKLSKNEWEKIGITAGWKDKQPITFCKQCDEPCKVEDGKSECCKCETYTEKEQTYDDTDINVEAKKKVTDPKKHGFIEDCVKKNKDKDNPGAYCASIVDKVKGTTDWRKKK